MIFKSQHVKPSWLIFGLYLSKQLIKSTMKKDLILLCFLLAFTYFGQAQVLDSAENSIQIEKTIMKVNFIFP